MNVDKETEKQIQELQIFEQKLNNVLIQKQAFQLEIDEVENALEELKKSGEDVFKIVGQIMVKSKKSDLQRDLAEKQKLVSIRLNSLNAEEARLTKNSEELRKKVLDKIQK